MMQNKEEIVIIDDSPLMLFALQNILDKYYQVYCFPNATEGISALKQINPSLILLDLVMHDIDGFDTIIQLKNNPSTRDIPVILMSAQNGDTDCEERSFMLGAVDFIVKPFKPSVVLARVRSQVRLYEYHKELEKTSNTDALTGIYNRRGFDQALDREWKRSMRDKTPLSLLMIDIDYFKKYNDHYGHQSGDNALHLVGQAIRGSLRRASDIPARYGGEEFTVLLPNVNEDGACTVAGHINRSVRALEIKHEYSEAAGQITVSIGIASSTEVEKPTELIELADHRLYAAKASGRNKFCGADGA